MTWRLSSFIRKATSPHDDGEWWWRWSPAQRIGIKRWKNEWTREEYTREEWLALFIHVQFHYKFTSRRRRQCVQRQAEEWFTWFDFWFFKFRSNVRSRGTMTSSPIREHTSLALWGLLHRVLLLFRGAKKLHYATCETDLFHWFICGAWHFNAWDFIGYARIKLNRKPHIPLSDIEEKQYSKLVQRDLGNTIAQVKVHLLCIPPTPDWILLLPI